jgi:hypothetical protein
MCIFYITLLFVSDTAVWRRRRYRRRRERRSDRRRNPGQRRVLAHLQQEV